MADLASQLERVRAKALQKVRNRKDEEVKKEEMKKLSREAYECLTQNILPFWLDNMLDSKRGGGMGR